MTIQAPAITIDDLSVRFKTARGTVNALDRHVSIKIPSRSFLTIVACSWRRRRI